MLFPTNFNTGWPAMPNRLASQLERGVARIVPQRPPFRATGHYSDRLAATEAEAEEDRRVRRMLALVRPSAPTHDNYFTPI
jgi:hypothetical protein